MANKTTLLVLMVLLYLSFNFATSILSIHPNLTDLHPNEFSKNLDNSFHCFEIERNALLEFKQSLIDQSGRMSSWHGKKCCAWLGVSCDKQTRHVTKLHLRNSYEWTYDFGNQTAYVFSCLGGNINPSLLKLHFLNYLDLSNNYFQHSKIPSFIGSLKQLRYLNLSYSSFEGLVPLNLGNLSNLRYLDLKANSQLKVSDLRWIIGFQSLKYLNLGGVNLSLASTTWMQSVNMLPSLSELRLSYCELPYVPMSFSFVNLTSLSVLDISENYQVNSSILPLWIFNISTLLELNLAVNNFKGLIYDLKYNWGNLCTLQSLDLSDNEFEGEIGEFVGSLGCSNMSLGLMNLGFNKMSGHFPYSLISFKCLKSLDLSYNSLSGPIPSSIGNLSRLEVLELSSNEMSGEIPAGIWKLQELRVLDLSSNLWEGILSDIHFQNLVKLKSFSVSCKNNSLSLSFSKEWIPSFSLRELIIVDCSLGFSFPAWLRTQKELKQIRLSNGTIRDVVPGWIRELTPQLSLLDLSVNQLVGELPGPLEFDVEAYVRMNSNNFTGPFPLWSNVEHLELRENRLSGSIPKNIGQLYVNLSRLDISRNCFTGSIPSSMSQLTSLQILDLSRNFLTGSIPSSMSQLTSLWILDLSNNHFSGEMFKPLKGLNQLQYMELSKNNFTDRLPKSFCLQFPVVIHLKLNMNNLSGDLSDLKKCNGLELLDLGENKFFGIIPKQIEEYFPELSVLRLRGNKLSGTIPEGLCLLSSLHVLDLAFNEFNGSIPRCIGNLVAFQRVIKYESSSSIVEGMDLVMKGALMEFKDNQVGIINMIDMSRNRLTGMIPKEITNLTFLNTLNFSWNQLHGPIPENIGDLHQLETLDVSCNNLEGTIPQSMVSMTALNHLNLSHNNLYGQIPSTNQFATFNDPSIYEGNPRLCGSPLPTNCGDAKHKDDNKDVVEDEDKYDKVWLYTGLVLGFATGFWAIVGSLVIKKSWRHSYFRFIEEKKYQMFVIVAITKTRVQRKLGFQRD